MLEINEIRDIIESILFLLKINVGFSNSLPTQRCCYIKKEFA